MPQSLSLVIVHIIFSTKERRPLLDTDTRPTKTAQRPHRGTVILSYRGLEAIDVLVTDSAAPMDLVDQLRARGLEVIIAPMP